MKYFIILSMLFITACSTTNVSDPTQGKGGFIDADGGSE